MKKFGICKFREEFGLFLKKEKPVSRKVTVELEFLKAETNIYLEGK